MSNKDNGKGKDTHVDEYDNFGLDGSEHGHEHLGDIHGDAPEGFTSDEEYGDGAFNLDRPPTMKAHNPSSGHEHDGLNDGGDYSDLHADGHEHGHEAHDGAHEGVHHGEQDGEEDYVPTEPSNTLLKRFGLPAGVAVVAVSVVGLGYMQFGDMLSSSGPVTPQQAPARPQPQPQATQQPGPGPRLPPAQPQQTAQTPQMPASGMNMTPAPAPVAQPSFQTAAQQPAQMPPAKMAPLAGPDLGMTPAQSTAPKPSPMPAPVAPAVTSPIENDLRSLIGEIHTMNGNFKTVSERLDQTRTAVMDRFDQTDGRIGDVGTKVGAVDQRVGGLEQRVAALETTRTAPVKTPITAVPAMPAVKAQGGINHSAPRPVVGTTVRKSVSERAFVLKGVSREAALVQTPGGLITVKIGETLNGMGVVQGFEAVGNSWVLRTSGGKIHP